MKRWKKLLLGLFGLGVLLIAASLIGLQLYLNAHKPKILQDVKALNRGAIQFERAAIHLWAHFPNITLSFYELEIRDSLYVQHQEKLLKAKRVEVDVSVKEILQRRLVLNEVRLYEGKIDFITLADGYNIFRSLTHKASQDSAAPPTYKVMLAQNGLGVNLHETRVDLDNQPKEQRVRAYINDLKSLLFVGPDTVNTQVDMDVVMHEMTLNPEKGSFFNGSRVRGEFWAQIVPDSHHVSIEPFDFHFDDQTFRTEADFYVGGPKNFQFKLENPQTQFRKSMNLLNTQIRDKVIHYDIVDPFYSFTTITGKFVRRGNPLVEVEFDTDSTVVNIWEYHLDSVDMKGRFVNRLRGNNVKADSLIRHFRIELDEGTGLFGGILLNSKEALFTRRQPDSSGFKFVMQGLGKPGQLSQLLDKPKFLFDKGNFILDIVYDGKYDGMEDVLMGSYATLQFQDFEVSYAPVKVLFPVKALTLEKAAGDSEFTLLSSTFGQKHDFSIEGGLNNFPNLIFDRVPGLTSSQAEIYARKLGWQDFLDLFGKQGVLKNPNAIPLREKTSALKQVVAGFYDTFDPKLRIQVDTFIYADGFEVHNFTSSLYYENAQTLILDSTQFEFEGGTFLIKLVLDIHDEGQTPFELWANSKQVDLGKLMPPFDYFDIDFFKHHKKLPQNIALEVYHKGILQDHIGLLPNSSLGRIRFSIDDGKEAIGTIRYEPDTSIQADETVNESYIKTQIDIEGKPSLISDLFNNEEFFFQNGHFKVEFAYTGDVIDLRELLQKSKSQLEVKNSEVFYKPADIVLPITALSLQMENEVADFSLLMRSDTLGEEILVNGTMSNFGALVLDDDQRQIQTAVELTSPHLSWKNFLTLFANQKLGSGQRETQGMKKTLAGVYETFSPTLSVSVDTFAYNSLLQFHNITSRATLDEFYNLVLDSTGLDFGEGHAQMEAAFNLEDLFNTPFHISFSTEDIDLPRLMQGFDYFNVSTFKDIEKMQGQVSMEGDLRGMIEDSTGLVPEESFGELTFEVAEVQVKGFERLQDLASKAFKRSRFEDIYFAPISNTVYVRGNKVEIPLMEIQSTALHMFVEGTFSYGDSTNLWISIPINNLRKRDGKTLPDKIGYAESGRKIYVEVYTNNEGEDEFKLRFKKKRFYEQNDMLEQYRIDKRENRKDRKAFLKARRRAKRTVN